MVESTKFTISETNDPTTGTRFTFFEINVKIVNITARPTVAPIAHAKPPIKLLAIIRFLDSCKLDFSNGCVTRSV